MKNLLKLGISVCYIFVIFGLKHQGNIHDLGQGITGNTGEQPNIILIMADDLGRECLSSYGSASYQTPNLDKLAEQGVRFENMFSQPLCTPSRVKIMTGKYNYRNYTDFGYLNPEEKTFGNILRDAGYQTMIAGKWQLNGIYRDKKQGWDNKNRPHHFGFDEYCLWQLTKSASRGERYANPLIIQNGKQLPRDKDQYGPDVFCNYVLNFMERHINSKAPFFVYYPMVLPHNPFVPTPDSPEWSNSYNRYQKDTHFFKDMVAYTDKNVGRIMDKLEETGMDENTLVIFTGDNGTNRKIVSTMNNGNNIKGMKGYMVDWGTRVPLIAYWKGHSQTGAVNTDLIEFSDVLPTLEDAAGIHTPAHKIVDGQSFLPQVLGDSVYPLSYVYMYYKPDWGGFDNGIFVRNKTYKLYVDGRFYNVDQDVQEKHPLSKATLTREERNIRQKLQNILDQKPTLAH